MYKCKECGAEYEQKPDYCDCGNDEFEDNVNIGLEEKTTSEIVVDLGIIENITHEENANQTISEKRLNTQKQVTYSSYQNLKKNNVDSASLVMFSLCILLSLYVIFFAWNVKEQHSTISNRADVSIEKAIPHIDKIWNNAVPKPVETKPPISEPVAVKVVVPEQKKQEPKKTVSTKQNNTTVVPLKKVTQPIKATSTAKPTSQTAKSAAVQPVQTVQDTAKQKAEQERLKAEAEQIKKLQAEQAKKAAEEKAKKDAIAKQELVNYKASLRNTIGRKIDFTRVIGDGSCIVTFKIDSNGKLTNRSFSKQSSNNTLNDEVYKAVMATPSFNPPPTAYHNENLNLSIKFYNGNFEISLP